MREATASLAELRNEHQSVLEHLDELRSAALNLMEGQRLEAVPALWRWVSFIDNALLPHFELEERTILPLMAQKSGSCRSLAEELMKEHTYIMGCLFRYKLLMQCDGLWSACQELQQLCAEIGDILPQHAAKEDEVIIPLLKAILGMTDDDTLAGHAPPVLYRELG